MTTQLVPAPTTSDVERVPTGIDDGRVFLPMAPNRGSLLKGDRVLMRGHGWLRVLHAANSSALAPLDHHRANYFPSPWDTSLAAEVTITARTGRNIVAAAFPIQLGTMTYPLDSGVVLVDTADLRLELIPIYESGLVRELRFSMPFTDESVRTSRRSTLAAPEIFGATMLATLQSLQVTTGLTAAGATMLALLERNISASMADLLTAALSAATGSQFDPSMHSTVHHALVYGQTLPAAVATAAAVSA